MALSNPHHYALMTSRPVPEYEPTADSLAFAASTIQPLRRAVDRGVDAGVLEGNPREITEALWAAGHGHVSLGTSGLLPVDDDRSVRYLRTIISGFATPTG